MSSSLTRIHAGLNIYSYLHPTAAADGQGRPVVLRADAETSRYDPTTWKYETEGQFAKTDIDHPRSVLNLMREHYRRYTPEMVERITGIPRDEFLQVAKLVGARRERNRRDAAGGEWP